MLKRLTFLSVLVLVVLVWGWPAMAAGPAADRAENIGSAEGAKAAGDILWHCDVQYNPYTGDTIDFQILGVETFHDTIYLTGGNNDTDPNRVHVWTRTSGTCHYQYSVDQASNPGWGWRDIACDGQYLYASDNYVLAAFTVAPGGVTTYPGASITVNSAQMPSLSPVRAVAYDEDNDWFWAVNFGNPIYAFDRSGNMMATAPNLAGSAYGMAYDNSTPGGPYLWIHVQDSTNVYQFHIPTLSFTGLIYSGWGDDDPGVSGIAGGLCVLEGDPSKGSVTLLGVMQGSPFDEMWAMEIYVHEDSLYWKPPYENYAPSGMPDIDMFQGYGWFKLETGRPTFDGPCAVANCFKWFDSKYEEGFGGVPGDADDQFPLVRDYLDAGPYFVFLDDHDPANVDADWLAGGGFTPWLQGGTTPPPATLQPFVPGYQNPPQMPPWGELVERLAWYVDLDAVQTGYCNHSGTRPQDMHDGIQDWFDSEMFEDSSTLADTLCVNIWPQPTFELVERLVEKCEDVILLLGFWYGEEGQEQQFMRGDFTADGVIDIIDIVFCQQGGPFSCDDAADVNDDGVWDMTDCDYLQNWWGGGPAPPPPFQDCGTDPTPDGLGCADFPICPGGGPGGWYRVGGHWVTVAGINSEDLLIAFSDPFIDNAEYGGRGRVGNGTVLPHDHFTFDHWTHNDEGNVSHDVYDVIVDPVTPGGLWEIANYGVPYATHDFIATRFEGVNVPPEFIDVTAPWDSTYPLIVEVEYAIQVSPWDYRGDVNVPYGDGVVNLADVVFVVNYLYKGGPAPVPNEEADVTCNGVVDLADVVYLINYLYKNGPVPKCCDP